MKHHHIMVLPRPSGEPFYYDYGIVCSVVLEDGTTGYTRSKLPSSVWTSHESLHRHDDLYFPIAEEQPTLYMLTFSYFDMDDANVQVFGLFNTPVEAQRYKDRLIAYFKARYEVYWLSGNQDYAVCAKHGLYLPYNRMQGQHEPDRYEITPMQVGENHMPVIL